MEQMSGKKRKNKWILFFIITIMILFISFLVFSFFTKSFIFEDKPRPVNTVFTFPMDELIINLQGDSRYLKTEIVLGYGVERDVIELKEKQFQLRDNIIGILRNKSREDIMPVENTGELKIEIKELLNQNFEEDLITDIYITEFIIQ